MTEGDGGPSPEGLLSIGKLRNLRGAVGSCYPKCATAWASLDHAGRGPRDHPSPAGTAGLEPVGKVVTQSGVQALKSLHRLGIILVAVC